MTKKQAPYESKQRRQAAVVSDTGPFALVPQCVLLSKLSAAAIRIYANLALHADKYEHTTFRLRSTIAKECGCSVRTVARALTDLAKLGAVSITHRKGDREELKESLYTVFRVPNKEGCHGRDIFVPTPPGHQCPYPQDTSGTGNQTPLTRVRLDNSSEEESSSSPRARKARARDDDEFLSSLEDLYSHLPPGLSNPITAPAKYFASVRANGSTIPRFNPTTAVRAALVIQHALGRALTFPQPKDAAGLEDVLALVASSPKLRSERVLRACVWEFLARDGEAEGCEVNRKTVLTRLARQPDLLRVVIESGP